MLLDDLQRLDLTKNEAVVYLALLEVGKSKAGALIEITKLHRNLVYSALEELEKRNLTTKTIMNGIACFYANSPDILIDETQERVRLAEYLANELKKKQNKEIHEITVYEGTEGIKQSRNQTLNFPAGETMYVLGANKLSSTPEWERYWRKFHLKREQLGIGYKILYEPEADQKQLDWRNSLPLSEAKYLPFDYDTPVWFTGIGNHFEISIAGEEPLTFVIKSKEAVDGFRKYFDYLWGQDVKIERGHEAVHRAFYKMADELQPGEEYFVLGTNAGQSLASMKEFFDEYHAYRIKKGIVANFVTYKDAVEVIKERCRRVGDPELKLTRTKAMMAIPISPLQTTLYKNKTFVILYSDNPTVIHFEQKEVFDGFKTYFDELWQEQA